MFTDHSSPCELIFKIGCNEYDEISSAITSLLRSCSITDQRFFFVERQIQPTSYFGSFTTLTSRLKNPIQCQSLSCMIFLTDDIFQQHGKKDFFKSTEIWNFHHKIELLDEYRQILARQDYYELSQLLPLWSISHISYNRQLIIRFNIFTKNFDQMIKFYKHLFQRQPDSSKTGFALFHLPSSIHDKFLYQLSIKYSPSIESYTVSQGAYLKFRLNNLNSFIHEYASKLFTINKFEYYIYDPDGNLLHLYLHNISTNIKESITSKSFIHTNDSGVGDSSDPSIQLLNSNMPQIYPTPNDIDVQSQSSNDSGQCTSISSNDFNPIKRTVYQNSISKLNSNITVRPATRNEIDCRLKQQQQQRTVFPRISVKSQQWKSSLYDSEPRLANVNYDNRCYASMNNVKKSNPIRPVSTHHFRSSSFKTASINDYDTSYEVDSPRIKPKTLTDQSSFGYLNAFLLKKQREQQPTYSHNVKQLIAQFEKSTVMATTTNTSRPKSASLVDQPLLITSKPTKNTFQRATYGSRTPIPDKSSQLNVKPQIFEWQDCNINISHMNDKQMNDTIDHIPNSRINIGITLDSRLRKTPVLDMLRSTTMCSDTIEPQRFNRTNSLKHSFVPIARF